MCLIFPQLLLSQTKEEIFGNLVKKLENAKNITFSFSSLEDKNYVGTLIANSQDRYRLTQKNKLIVCDGISVWNFTPSEKQVLISRFKPNSASAIQSIFFDIKQNYIPTNATKVKIAKSYQWQLSLKSRNNPDDTINLTLDKKYNVIGVNFKIGTSIGNLKISKIRINSKIQESTFIFKSPKGIEELDLR